jgi:hypothetical protein
VYPLTLSINPAACLRALPEHERAYVGIPAPEWMARDPLERSFSRYPDLWFGGKVVWGRIVQVNTALFSAGDLDLPGDVVYDPTGVMGHQDLAEVAQKLFALKGTTPTDRALRAFADHLADEYVRACGLRVPECISQHRLLVSTLLFHRKHLPDRKITLPHFPVLINDKFPGVVMALPSRWWPAELMDRQRVDRPQADRPRGGGNMPVAKTGLRHCSHCKEPMLKLGLAAHYQRTVEIDVCEPCSLIWFDDTESARLAGPGLADLVRVIHAAMQQPRPLQPLPHRLPCPICSQALKRVSNISRYGRTAQLECGDKHGAYQSFALFLAEKGYFRPFTWADVKQALESGKSLACFNCGAKLEARPQAECQYCRSPVGLIDPSRLASAIDSESAAEPLRLLPALEQSACPCCGGAIALSTEMICPHCQAVVRPVETAQAVAASESVVSRVRDNYAQQTAAVSRRKLEYIERSETPAFKMPGSESLRRGAIIVVTLLSLGFIISKMAFRSVDMTERNPDGRPVGMNPVIWEGIQNAKREKEMAQIPHAPAGVVPRELGVTRHDDGSLTVVNRSTQRLKVAVDLVHLADESRCKMKNADGKDPSSTATFTRAGESHSFAPDACTPKFLVYGKYEYRVWSLDESRYLFKSDSAFQ